jgi:hypothetical protein
VTIPTRLSGLVAPLALLALAELATASDHADPTFNKRLEAGITDLFAFPTKNGVRTEKDGDSLVLILCTRRSLAKTAPFEGLDQVTFHIHLDLSRQVSMKDKSDLGRYGGTVVDHESIKEEVTIRVKLNENAKLMERKKDALTGLRKLAGVEWWSGLRDDPFIFPQFFGTNVIAFVIKIPFDCFPPGKEPTWLIWATSSRHGEQVDHVGRSQRTQLPRFDFLNTIHPSKHVGAIKDRRDNPPVMQDVLRRYIPTEFNFRPFDLQPDVMIYSRPSPVKFPNGRQLEDDVAAETCKWGDCQLFELSFAHPKSKSQGGQRPTMNDKAFLAYWPYLAEPHENPMEPPPPALMTRTQIIFWTVGAVVVVVFLLPWFLYFRAVRKLRSLARQAPSTEAANAAAAAKK